MADRYMTRRECKAAMAEVGSDIADIKRALVGDDMRGGMVKDIERLNMKVDQIVENGKNSTKFLNRWKLAIFGAAISLTVAIVGVFLR
jgi:hypothetical protein